MYRFEVIEEKVNGQIFGSVNLAKLQPNMK